MCYINRVIPTEETFGDGNPVSWHRHNIVFVDNFVDAAVHAATTKFRRTTTLPSPDERNTRARRTSTSSLRKDKEYGAYCDDNDDDEEEEKMSRK